MTSREIMVKKSVYPNNVYTSWNILYPALPFRAPESQSLSVSLYWTVKGSRSNGHRVDTSYCKRRRIVRADTVRTAQTCQIPV
ncbi:hypothetical protein TNCV_1728361 [Trichonephila clavipes]|nr:hypothetical protein TNCV_1728361 [Trichonephila clavipes]